MPEPGKWEIQIGYMPKLGQLKVMPTCPHGAGTGEVFLAIPFTDLVQQIGIKPEQLRAHMKEAEKPTSHFSTLSQEALCDEAVRALDLTGKTVLDIGGFTGRAAKVALDQGAKRAICLDNRQWKRYGWQEPEPLDGVEYEQGDFMDWQQPVDVVLFFNVAYHCPDPRGALKHLRSITTERMLLCSLVVWDDRPVWYPHEPFEVNPEDDTVYWSPSDAGLKKLLKATGWTDVQERGKTVERLVLDCT